MIPVISLPVHFIHSGHSLTDWSGLMSKKKKRETWRLPHGFQSRCLQPSWRTHWNFLRKGSHGSRRTAREHAPRVEGWPDRNLRRRGRPPSRLVEDYQTLANRGQEGVFQIAVDSLHWVSVVGEIRSNVYSTAVGVKMGDFRFSQFAWHFWTLICFYVVKQRLIL